MKSLVIVKAPTQGEGKTDQYHPSLPILKDSWLTKHSCPKSLARSIWNWRSKKVWRLGLLFIQRWSLLSGTRRHQTLGKRFWGKDLYYLGYSYSLFKEGSPVWPRSQKDSNLFFNNRSCIRDWVSYSSLCFMKCQRELLFILWLSKGTESNSMATWSRMSVFMLCKFKNLWPPGKDPSSKSFIYSLRPPLF